MQTDSTPAPPDRRLLAIFLIVLIDVLGITIILPLLPFYSEHFGARPFVVGALVSTYSLCQLVAGPILGRWSDRIGRRPVLIVSQMGTLCGFILLAFAPSLAWVFVARAIDGLTAGNLSTAQAYISDISEPSARARSLGKIGVAFGIGFFIGPALTAFLFRFGYRAPILAAAMLSLLSIVASAVLLPRHAPPPGGRAPAGTPTGFLHYFRQPALAPLLLQIFLFYFSFSAYMSGFALFAERRFTLHGLPFGPRQVGYAFTYFGFLGIIVQGFLIGRLVRRWGEARVARFGFAASGLGYGLLSIIHSPFWIGVTGLLTGFGSGVLRPALTSELSGCANPRERGAIMGVNQSLQSIAQIAAPLIGTALIERSALTAWAWFPALISGLGWVLTSYWTRKAAAT